MPVKTYISSSLFIIITFLLTGICGESLFAQSQPYPFKQFPIPQDLPPVSSMLQDHLGFIWLGTNEGLYRFDGIHFTYYSGKDAENNPGREAITYIYEDHQHILWIGAKTGLYRYNPGQKNFDKFSLGDETYPRYIYAESDTTILVHADKGIFMLYSNSGKWKKLSMDIPDDKILAVKRGGDNDLWIGSDNFIRKYDVKEKAFIDFQLPVPSFAQAGEKISAVNLFLDSRDQLWINTWFKGMIIMDTKSGVMQSFDTYNPDRNKNLLELFNPSMAEDAAGNVWVVSQGSGINIYHQDSKTFSHILPGQDYAAGLIGNYFAVMADRDQNMWVKSAKALHYLPHERPIPELKSSAEGKLYDALFMHFLKPGYILMGSFFGLYGINLETKTVDNFNHSIQLPATHNAEFQAISDLFSDDDQNLWLASPQGLRHVKYAAGINNVPQINFVKLYPTRQSFWPSRIIQLDDTTLIVKGRSNTKVFAEFHMTTGEFEYHEFPDSLVINQLINYKDGTILIGMRNKGLYYYDVAGKSSRMIPWKDLHGTIKNPKPVFHRIKKLENGTYGLCTENAGMYIFDPVAETFRQIDVAPLANSNIVFSVEEDANQNLWIQTSTQLLFYDVQTTVLSKVNLANSFKGSAPYFFMHEGKELYTTFEGYLYHIGVDRLLTKSEKPNLYLEDMKAGNLQLDWNSTERIRLGYSDNFLTYDFIGIDYDNPRGITYWYKMPELSEEWVNIGNQTSISFGRLSPGNYHFILKASNDTGLWSDEVHAPVIRITPPFWKTWWFITGMVLIAVITLSWIWKLRKMKTESERKLRNQIARDLHDDIGSTLSGIKIYSGIASQMAGDNKELTVLLDQVVDKSDTMMQSMSDIVWSINPSHDSLQDIVIRIKQYMSEILESQNIEVKFSSGIDLKSQKIDLRHRKELYLALKEIVNNVAKHSGCRHLNFNIEKQKSEIVFTLRDDGIGMNENQVVSGNGLKNIEWRIKQIDGKINRISSPGNGTSYEIRVEAM